MRGQIILDDGVLGKIFGFAYAKSVSSDTLPRW